MVSVRIRLVSEWIPGDRDGSEFRLSGPHAEETLFFVEQRFLSSIGQHRFCRCAGITLAAQARRGRIRPVKRHSGRVGATVEQKIDCWTVSLVLSWLAVIVVLPSAPLVTAAATVDPKAEVAAALYAASATQAAAERAADAKLQTQRKEIEKLQAAVRSGAAQHQTNLTAAEEKYVAALAARDRVYAQEIAVFRKAVEDIAATPEGAVALARFNAGDEPGALLVLDQLRAAHDAARKKRVDLESAVEARRIATLALEARIKGKQTTAQVITRYEEVTRLDPGVHWDWIELGRLYHAIGNLPAALRTAHASTKTAADDRDRSVANNAVGDVLVAQGDLPAALTAYRASHAIFETLAKRDPGNAQWQVDVAVSCAKLGTQVGIAANERRAYLERGLNIQQKLQAGGRLAPNQNWIDWFSKERQKLEEK